MLSRRYIAPQRIPHHRMWVPKYTRNVLPGVWILLLDCIRLKVTLTVSCTVVDMLTKISHFIPIVTTITAYRVPQLFMRDIVEFLGEVHYSYKDYV